MRLTLRALRILPVHRTMCMVFFDELDEALTVGAVSPSSALRSSTTSLKRSTRRSSKQLYAIAMGDWASADTLDAVGTGVRLPHTLPVHPAVSTHRR